MQNLSSINYLNLLIELIFHGISEFKPVTKEICKVPSFFSTALFRKIDSDSTGVVTRYVLFSSYYWVVLSKYMPSWFLIYFSPKCTKMRKDQLYTGNLIKKNMNITAGSTSLNMKMLDCVLFIYSLFGKDFLKLIFFQIHIKPYIFPKK